MFLWLIPVSLTFSRTIHTTERRNVKLSPSSVLWFIVALVDVLILFSLLWGNGNYFVDFLDFVTEWIARVLL